MTKCFIDTNVIVYANDTNAGTKQTQSLEVISTLMREKAGTLSIQVLQEYANTALTKLNQNVPVVLGQIRLLESFPLVAQSPQLVRRSIEIRSTYGISFWDAAILAAAEFSNCKILLSEDLNPAQFYAGVTVVNPFAAHFDLVALLR